MSPLRRWAVGAALILCTGCARPEPIGGPRVTPTLAGRFEIERGLFGATDQAVALGDCNGDGRLDVSESAPWHVAVQDGAGAFSPVPLPVPLNVSTFVDLDGDGLLDLVADGLGSAIVFLRGHGDCHFDAPVQLARLPMDLAHVTQILVADVDLDGRSDLLVSRHNGVAGPFMLLLARGDGTFEATTPPVLAVQGTSPFLAFTTLVDDVDGDGVNDLFVGVDHQASWFSWGTADEPAPAYVRDDSITPSLVPANPMSMSPLDFDRDGRIDYFISGEPGLSRLLRNVAPRKLSDLAQAAGLAGEKKVTAWGALSFDADLDGWTDLLRLQEVETATSHAPHRPALYLNRHDGTFEEVSEAAFDGELWAEQLVCGDLESDGRVSCLAREEAGTVLLRNRLTPTGGFVGVRLRGTVSAPDASGARVSLDGEARPLVVVAGGQSPVGGEHVRDVRLAVGARSSASVSVTWPSGIVQHLADLPAGRYTLVTEPGVLTVSRRVAPADGVSTIEVTADALEAGVDASELHFDEVTAGAWRGPATVGADGKVHRTLVAPAVPGEARVTLRIGDTALRVRPRIRFVAP